MRQRINKDYITIYDKKNINLDLVYDEIIMSIVGIPSKSYGISIKAFKNNSNNRLNLTFECRLEKEEDENIILRIYTGKKWRELKESLSISYKSFNIYEEFDFNSMSRWRISTTSNKIGQKIFIKNIYFTY